MTSLTEFFNKHEDDALKGISHKNSIIKRNIIAYMAVNGECTLSELTKELHISVPTITKLVQELVDENIVTDLGKVETPGGRRPNIFGLANSAIYFAGVNVGRDNMTFLITDLQNNIIKEEYDYTFELQDRPQCFERICSNIENFIATCGIDRGKILGLGVCMTGRVNPDTGRSYKYFTSSEQSLREVLEERVGLRVLLENDTRARCYAEYTCGKSKDESNVLYLHMGRGVAIGIVVDGQLYYGKSGFAGEFGHIPFFDNEIICSCGKKGCLETEVSGIAIEDKMCHLIEKGVNTILKEKYDQQKSIHIDDIIAAAKNDDNLSIELIEEAGEKVGKAVAFLINTFQPRDGHRRRQYGRRRRLHHAPPQVCNQQIFAQPRIQGHQIPRIEDDRERERMGCGNAHPQQDHRHLMNLEGRTTRLRALEPGDIELMYAWENDTQIWGVSGTLAPFSRHTLERFIEGQQFDIFQTRQQRLIIETPEGLPVGALDLFDLDPVNLRAGVGILIHDTAQRGKGYAADAVETVCSYARDMLHLHQLWCSVEAGNAASLALFRNAGFSETGVRKEWLRLADGFHDEVFLQKIL